MSVARSKLVQFEWKLDPLALAALLLSVIAAIGQFVAWWSGPSVRLITPDTVALYTDTAPDGTVIVRIAAPMAYANVAQAAYGDLVVKERAKLSAGDIQTQQQWNSFGDIKKGLITATQPSSVQPLAGQSAVAHFTLFAPMVRDCPPNATRCQPREDYVAPEQLAAELGKADRLHFTFEIDMVGGGSAIKSCDVPLTPLVRTQLAGLRRSFMYAVCHRQSSERM